MKTWTLIAPLAALATPVQAHIYPTADAGGVAEADLILLNGAIYTPPRLEGGDGGG